MAYPGRGCGITIIRADRDSRFRGEPLTAAESSARYGVAAVSVAAFSWIAANARSAFAARRAEVMKSSQCDDAEAGNARFAPRLFKTRGGLVRYSFASDA